MKKQLSKQRVGIVRLLAIALLVVAFALISMPLNLLGARAEVASEERAAEEKNGGVQQSAQAAVSFTLTINYYRSGSYDGWWLWLWDAGKDGVDTAFTSPKNIGGKQWRQYTKQVTDLTPADDGKLIGFIVRDTNWNKDPDGDRYVTVDDIKNGKIEIWLITDDATIYTNKEDAIEAMNEASRNKITTAYFATYKRVHFDTSVAITNKSVFKLKKGDDVVKTIDCSLPNNSQYVGAMSVDMSFTEEVDITASYTVVDEPDEIDEAINFAKRAVSKTKLFSTDKFETDYGYTGTLGAEYSATQTVFTVWAPTAGDLKLNIYDAGTGGTATVHDMARGEKGTWTKTVSGDLKNKYYTYSVVNGNKTDEVVDPYARSGGTNGKRGMIVDLDSTDPTGWSTQQEPTLASNTHAVIYEAQLRDLTIHESSGVSAANRGKFLGLTETGTKNASGKATALDYLKELGVTQVHFQPMFDFASVDENFTTATYNKDGEYNWGYDPLNYNMPEGSYSSDPSDGTKRVNEMKQMIMALHNAGIQVVMDVVYNHVSDAAGSNFEKLVPGYYFRTDDAGKYLDGSGCGNGTASERVMFRKFMIDSVKYWTQEYKVDGFRFDLMGLHDIDTMNQLYDALHAINPDVIVYGEGWDASSEKNGLPVDKQAKIANAAQMPNIAFFDDVIRDGLKGSVFTVTDTGFISGKADTDKAVYVGAYGATNDFAANPTQNINYVACHDNSLLWDKLNASVDASRETLKAINRLAAVSVLTSQGIAFFPAGEEMLRSKRTEKDNTYDNRATVYKTDSSYYYSDNSYKSPDSVNAIDWNLLDTNADMVEFYKGLIAIKKTWPQFQIETKADIDACVTVKDDNKKDGVAVYVVKDPSGDASAVVILNNNSLAQRVAIPQGDYEVFVDGDKASTDKLGSFSGSEFTVGARSAAVLRANLTADAVSGFKYAVEEVPEAKSNLGLALGLGIGIPVAILIAGGVVFGVLYSKKKKGNGGDDKGGDSGDKADAEPATDTAAEEKPEAAEQPAEAEEAKQEEQAADAEEKTETAEQPAEVEEAEEAKPEEKAEEVEEAKSEEKAEEAEEAKPEEKADDVKTPDEQPKPKKPAAKKSSGSKKK
ncbi:MAG: type I pullulanase [Roseburia sp.]|nr:type I pullulanase [Roseburia sp.]